MSGCSNYTYIACSYTHLWYTLQKSQAGEDKLTSRVGNQLDSYQLQWYMCTKPQSNNYSLGRLTKIKRPSKIMQPSNWSHDYSLTDGNEPAKFQLIIRVKPPTSELAEDLSDLAVFVSYIALLKLMKGFTQHCIVICSLLVCILSYLFR